MSKKYQIFISSTYRDLEEERRKVTQAVLDLGQIPSGMESFPAYDKTQFDYIKKMIDDSDYYIVIVGARYGQIDSDGVSFTEKEYDYAKERGKYVLAFIHEKPEEFTTKRSDTAPKAIASLEAFRKKLGSGRLFKYWLSPESLSTAVLSSLAVAMSQEPQIGWIRGNAAASEDLLARLEKVREENEQLRLELIELRSQEIQVDDAAFLRNEVELNFSWSEYTHHGTYQRKGTEIFTWHEIVIAICPGLYQPCTIAKIGSLISTYLKERKGKRTMTLAGSDEQLIKITLETLGLINAYQANSTGGGVYEYLSVTSKGKKLLGEMMVKRE